MKQLLQKIFSAKTGLKYGFRSPLLIAAFPSAASFISSKRDLTLCGGATSSEISSSLSSFSSGILAISTPLIFSCNFCLEASAGVEGPEVSEKHKVKIDSKISRNDSSESVCTNNPTNRSKWSLRTAFPIVFHNFHLLILPIKWI